MPDPLYEHASSRVLREFVKRDAPSTASCADSLEAPVIEEGE
jgi:hypothetical protein